MKKLLTLSLGLSLTLLGAATASAAPHNFTNDLSNPFLSSDYNYAKAPGFEGWYYIGQDAPSATVRGAFNNDVKQLGGEYYVNDQTFANLYYRKEDKLDAVTNLKGSYLFDNGIFAGLDYQSKKDDKKAVLSPGYRLDLEKKAGYVAASVDYLASTDYGDTGLNDVDITARFYTKDSRVHGQVIIPNKDVAGTDKLFIYAGGAYKYSKNVILGANVYKNDKGYNDKTKFDLGCTTGFDKLGLEFKYENDDKDSNLYFNALYSLTKDFRAGLQVNKKEIADDPFLFAKCKFFVDKQNSLVLIQKFENSSIKTSEGDAVTYLRWDIALK